MPETIQVRTSPTTLYKTPDDVLTKNLPLVGDDITKSPLQTGETVSSISNSWVEEDGVERAGTVDPGANGLYFDNAIGSGTDIQFVNIRNGVAGKTYKLIALAVTSSGQEIKAAARMRVNPV